MAQTEDIDGVECDYDNHINDTRINLPLKTNEM